MKDYTEDSIKVTGKIVNLLETSKLPAPERLSVLVFALSALTVRYSKEGQLKNAIEGIKDAIDEAIVGMQEMGGE